MSRLIKSRFGSALRGGASAARAWRRKVFARLRAGARIPIRFLRRRRRRRHRGRSDSHLDYFAATGLDALYPLYPGNRIRLFREGSSAFRSIERAIRGARESVLFEVYIFAADESGERILSLLVDAARRGARVILLVDAVGSLETGDAFFAPLVEAGGRVEWFNPIFGWRRKRWNPNQRDHRKILVVDGRIAFLGGMNVDDATSANHAVDSDAWRDTHARVTGPVVGAIRDLFADHFEWVAGERLAEDPAAEAGAIPPAGDSSARVVGGEPGTRLGPIRRAYGFALRRARKSVYLTTAYFVPPRSFLRRLKRAARRGVDVRVLVPGRTDYVFVQRAGQSFYSQLLRSGVRLYEWSRSPLHAKTAVVDGVWGVVGSANLDVRSFELNYEADLHVSGPRVGFLLTATFMKDIAASDEIRLAEWEKRSLWRKITEKFCALFRRFL